MRRSARTTQPQEPREDPFPVGSYLTNGGSLIGVVGVLPQEPSLRLVEDCQTLEITVVSVQDLHDAGVEPVARTGVS